MQNSSALQKICLTLAAFALVALALMALPSPRAHAQAGGQGKIEGQIVNGTKDAKPASTADLTVTLLSAAAGTMTPITVTAQTDTNGKFSFTNLDTISTTRYLVIFKYADVDYYSNMLNFSSPTSATLPVNITVYESTTDASVVQVSQTHLVVDVQSPWLPVLQVVALENISDRVYIGQEYGPHRISLVLPILPKAINIQFDDQMIDQTTMRGEDVLSYTLPIPPGKDQILYEYAVQFTPPTYDLNLQMPYNTGKFAIFVVDVGAKVQSAQLAPTANPMSGVQGAPNFIALGGEKFAAGTTIKATFTNLPSATPQTGTGTPVPSSLPVPSLSPTNPQTIALVVLGVAIVAALALLVYQMIRNRAAPSDDEEDAEDAERQNLLQEIADLDDAREASEISEAEHQDKRAALKKKLAELDE